MIQNAVNALVRLQFVLLVTKILFWILILVHYRVRIINCSLIILIEYAKANVLWDYIISKHLRQIRNFVFRHANSSMISFVWTHVLSNIIIKQVIVPNAHFSVKNAHLKIIVNHASMDIFWILLIPFHNVNLHALLD